MKRLLKILTPAISSLGIATMALTSCGTKQADDFVAIPSQYLYVDGTTLKGLKPGEHGEYIDLVEMGYSKLTIAKDITNITNFSYTEEKIGYNAITKIDFESDRSKECYIADYCFSALPELGIIELPKNCNKIVVGDCSFMNCDSLSIIDFHLCESINSSFTSVEWIQFGESSSVGKLYASTSNKTTVEAIKAKNTHLKNWTIEVK